MLFVIKKKQSLLSVIKTKQQYKNKKSGNKPQTANQLVVCICGPSLRTHALEEGSGLSEAGM